MESSDNPLIDTGNVTVNAFNAIKRQEKTNTSITLGKDDTKTWTSPNFKVKVKAWTKADDKTHTYFHSLSIDVNVEDFMGTAELKCPYDSDLMEYWEPIRQTVVIYGANRGDYKILFIGRVRGVKQDGYELVVEFQNYAWKFKQLVTQSYANDNVLNKDGFTILRLMFEALKIDSWVISPSARYRLKQVGINKDGNLTLNGKEVKKMPDLLKRLQASDPKKAVNKYTVNNKLREKYLHNIDNINYTLKYEKPTKRMQKISSAGNYTAGSNIYENPYGSATGGASGGGSSGGVAGKTSGSVGGSVGRTGSHTPPSVYNMGSSCKSVPSSIHHAFKTLWSYHRGYTNSYSGAQTALNNYARSYPNTYWSSLRPCLQVLEQYNPRGGSNAASICIGSADRQAALAKTGVSRQVEQKLQQGYKTLQTGYNAFATGVRTTVNNVGKAISNVGGAIYNGFRGLFG